jgi:hypothetical protein
VSIKPDYSQALEQRRALFDEGEACGYKRSLYEVSRDPAAFFCINALPDVNTPRKNEYVINRRNFLIEFDSLPDLAEQEERFERKFAMPYLTKVYSGGKSIHYILGVHESLSDDDYRLTFKLLCSLFSERRKDPEYKGKNDDSCGNPSRLSRTAGMLRDNGIRQELLGIGARVPHKNLIDHIASFDPITFNVVIRQHEESKQRMEYLKNNPIEQDDLTPLPGWIQWTLDTGKFKGSSRHDFLTRVSAGMHREGYHLERIEATLYRLQDVIGLAAERDDVPGILQWSVRNL